LLQRYGFESDKIIKMESETSKWITNI
jgi:hypothetical protein